MIIVGAGGFAKEVLSCLSRCEQDDVCFYDDVHLELKELFGQFKVLKTENAVKTHFKFKDNRFTIGVGDPSLRIKVCDHFTQLGGQLTSVISDRAFIGEHDVQLGDGVNILPGVNISNSVILGKAVLVYYNANITHDCNIGDFVEVSPGVQILGRVNIGHKVKIGAGAIILPDVTIGDSVIIGAGAVVTQNIEPNSTVVGIPAKPIFR